MLSFGFRGLEYNKEQEHLSSRLSCLFSHIIHSYSIYPGPCLPFSPPLPFPPFLFFPPLPFFFPAFIFSFSFLPFFMWNMEVHPIFQLVGITLFPKPLLIVVSPDHSGSTACYFLLFPGLNPSLSSLLESSVCFKSLPFFHSVVATTKFNPSTEHVCYSIAHLSVTAN